ncbi:DEAH-box ATP-dependent RNA helicase PRP22 Ecym_1263 [Eremothecium cymbalariae DBVPG|uniref:RNA helicase n=1 Tax=Eremothecium cymbalariae (strain CBS 270.75 / DBVPG 7215 / KCTC 17166 / NRRL Y-17582) TaxID=931890 RepID=G8JN41_ERECY|nr:hypothetical protein Ecym_1263 [Eremothecium cymbalariae DBVPG\
MSVIQKKISNILQINDSVVADFVLNIYAECNNVDTFIDKIEQLGVGISRTRIQELYQCVNQYKKDQEKDKDKESSPKDAVSELLKTELGIDDPAVVDFIVDIHSKQNSLSGFHAKLNEMDSGLSSNIIFKIYKVLKPEVSANEDEPPKTSRFTGLALPNSDLKWDDIKGTGFREPEMDPAPLEGKIYPAKVKNITSFGCFAQILGTKERYCDGLLHISELSHERPTSPHDIVSTGQDIYVKVIRIQPNGKISLSMKAVDQLTGEEIQGSRGRSMETQIKRRQLTSPERWEIRQLIQSGVASVDEYPELREEVEQLNHQPQQQEINKRSQEVEEHLELELNIEDEPKFLSGQLDRSKKPEMPIITRVPKGSLNNTAMNGSHTMLKHRKEKLAMKRDVERDLQRQKDLDDPSHKKNKIYQDQQLALTAWERDRMQEKVMYGKRTSLPIKAQREALPVFKMREKLVRAIRDHQFLVIVGETGSGKTTQITQYLDEEGFSINGLIGCTQPRRVAAVSVAKRVAEEMGTRVGCEVGYVIRFEDETSALTRIKYMTDGMLQREALLDPLMSKYSVILLDEAHERTVATDVLFGLLKQSALKRPELKVIVTSATLDSDKISKYFMNCPIIQIPGKTFPVDVVYAKTPQVDYIESALDTVMEIHINEPEGDILVFLTGQEEIDTSCEILYERVSTLGNTIQELLILPVYSALPSEIQSKIFEPTPKGSRKVIFATNIAETSITIDGIYYVVDPGFAKVNTYNPRMGMEQLVVAPISQAQANQRKGRAGRTGPGKCYRLYTESAFKNEMLRNTIPEIQRQNLEHTILMLKAMGINDLLNFEFMDPPPKSLMLSALEALYNLQALDDEGYLTKLGKRMSQFPMEPSLSKALIAAVDNGCSDEILTIISMLSVQNVFYRPKDKQRDADNKKVRFHHPYGDHLTLLNVYKRWNENNFSKNFCLDNYLHERHLKRARDVRNQLKMIFKKLAFPITSCNGDIDLIRKTLVSGFFRNAAKRDPQIGGYRTIADGTSITIHPSSSLFGKDYEYVIYHSLVLTTREYMSQVTVIDPHWLTDSAPHFYKPVDPGSDTRKKTKIVPLHNKFSKDQDSWRLSSIRQSKERALGIKR